ncbi:hypothetical protein Cgig2_004320 [Carnegiea gigantea]|uniref:Endonuclease/exonuclease/phosphatase domain-containing protein n=1 Tax=Carnegiea gigantea TaxID=171969 RepID=A0A9Q1GV78_9CARY|nr:hypothetical protein Cgig2_004320 [Carnegiea gigantea]
MGSSFVLLHSNHVVVMHKPIESCSNGRQPLTNEIKKTKPEIEDILHNIGDFHGIFVDSRGRSRGVALLWDKNVTVNFISGYDFTWCIFQENGIVVEERLDHFCTDIKWSLIFPNAMVSHVDFDMSDHLPILLKCTLCSNEKEARKRRFMFENMWLTDPSCQDTVSAAWTSVLSPNTVENMLSRLEKCTAHLME